MSPLLRSKLNLLWMWNHMLIFRETARKPLFSSYVHINQLFSCIFCWCVLFFFSFWCVSVVYVCVCVCACVLVGVIFKWPPPSIIHIYGIIVHTYTYILIPNLYIYIYIKEVDKSVSLQRCIAFSAAALIFCCKARFLLQVWLKELLYQ